MSSSPPELELRPYRPDDFDAVANLCSAVSVEAFGYDDESREELRQWFTSPRVDLERDTRLAFLGGELAGYADADTDDGGATWWSDIRILPGHLDTAFEPLLAWVEERAGGGLLRAWAGSKYAAYRSALESHGFQRTRASYRMSIDLDGEIADVVLPAGVEIRTLQPGDEPAAHAVHQETFADSWEHTYEPFDEWRHWLVDTESFDPSLWFLAWHGDELAGIAFCRVREGDGFVGILGVRRPWRKQGLGRALLLHAFHEFRGRGFARVALGVDAESLTGAHRLYESVGMRVIRQLDFFEKRLADPRRA